MERFKLDRYLPLLSALAILLASPGNHALAEPRTELIEIKRSWVDEMNKNREITLRFTEERARRGLLGGKDLYDVDEVFDAVYSDANQLAKSLSTEQYQARVRWKERQYNIETIALPGYESKARAIERAVQSRIQESKDHLNDFSYYKIMNIGSTKLIAMDYPAVTKDYADILDDLHKALSLVEIGISDKARIDTRLRFLQSIPYDDMSTNDFGLMTPLRMMAEWLGDCESKQIVLAGLMRRLFPDQEVYLVALPDHEHIVLALEATRKDSGLYFHNGRDYWILDATGPGFFNVDDSAYLIELYDLDRTTTRWMAM